MRHQSVPNRRVQPVSVAQSSSQNIQMPAGVFQALDFSVAVLLLTGQITTSGVFIMPDAISVSCSGPIFGGNRLQGRNKVSQIALDGIDVLLALLLILGEVTIIGPWVGYQVLSIVVGGPPFHFKRRDNRSSPRAEEVYKGLRSELVRAYADYVQQYESGGG